MKKIGILTILSGINYGQLLQAFAMMRSVSKMGYDCEIINIPLERHKPFLLRLFNFAIRLCTSNPLSELKKELNSKKRKQLENSFKSKYSGELIKQKTQFDSFKKQKLNISEIAYSDTKDIVSRPPVYDAYICGSDQIWNPEYIFNHKKHEYFLSFAPKNKRVSYAPSFGVQNLPHRCVPFFKKWISQIPYLSCREAVGTKIIKELSGRDAIHVLDPTLLLTQAEWDEAVSDATLPDISEPYILCYILGKNTDYETFLGSAIKETCYNVIVLPTLTDKGWNEHTIGFETGPSEFVALVKNSSLVVTDSFHGVAFSIIYNKPFAVFQRSDNSTNKPMFSRISSLLSMCKIDTPIMNETSTFDKNMLDMDFSAANVTIRTEQEKSTHYLMNSLKKAIAN